MDYTTNFPGQIYAGGAADSNMLNAIHVISGSGTDTYQDALYTYIMSTPDSSFVKEGTYESQVHDLISVYKWASLNVNYTTNDNTNITIETATSENNIDWSGWSSVSKQKEINGEFVYKINSPANRYIKVRFSLSSGDGILSPVVEDYAINYYQDLEAPTNPDTSGLNPQSSGVGGETILTNNWYNHDTPVFAWDDEGEVLGASDGSNGSGVAGYYVYWGTDDQADPAQEGSLQTEVVYIPNTLVDASTYFLRVKTIDEAGNISDSTWQPFVYKYDSSGPSKVENLSADPSGYTSTDNFSFNWDALSTTGAQVTAYCLQNRCNRGSLLRRAMYDRDRNL